MKEEKQHITHSDKIEMQYKDLSDLYDYLMKHDQVTFASDIKDVYKKVLLLSAASFFESEISTTLLQFAENACKGDKRLRHLIESKVIQRQYHTLFDWTAKNTNVFWRLFGNEEYARNVRKKLQERQELLDSEKAFLWIGERRNLLVHKNFAEYAIDDTSDEIYAKYRDACTFIDFIKEELC